jgi:hypothetical protein
MRTFAADLHHSHDLVAGENGSTIIFWMNLELSSPVFTPSKTVAWRARTKLMMSGRLSRASERRWPKCWKGG